MDEKFENGNRINEFGEIERPTNKQGQKSKGKTVNVIEVPSKKERNGERVTLEVAIKDLPKGEEDIDNLIAAVKRNGEEGIIKQKKRSISGFGINLRNRFTRAVGSKIRDISKKREEKRKVRVEKIEKVIEKITNDKKFQKKAVAAGIGVGIILIAIPICLQSCNGSDKSHPQPEPEPTSITETVEEPTTNPEPSDQTVEIMVRDEKPVDIEIYEIQNPYEILEGIVNSAGQEGLTANNIEGDSFEGDLYNGDEQFAAENRASEGVEEFKQIKTEIEKNMQILIDSSQSTQNKKIAVERLLELNQEVETIFTDNKEFAEEYSEKFAEASKAYQDTNTENEIIAVNGMVDNLKAELGLSSHNVSQISMINQLLEKGYELNITSVEKDLRGTYKISGKAIKDLLNSVDLSEAKETWSEFATVAKSGEIGENSTINLTTESGEKDYER